MPQENPQMHYKIITLIKNNYGLRLQTWIRKFIEGWNSINIHQPYSNGFLNGHMDYNQSFELTFKCIFCYDFISIFFIGTQYMIHDEKKIWIEKNYNKKFNQQIIMNFQMTKFGPYFQKSQSWSFFVGLIFFPP
jgi:hypothetical protein